MFENIIEIYLKDSIQILQKEFTMSHLHELRSLIQGWKSNNLPQFKEAEILLNLTHQQTCFETNRLLKRRGLIQTKHNIKAMSLDLQIINLQSNVRFSQVRSLQLKEMSRYVITMLQKVSITLEEILDIVLSLIQSSLFWVLKNICTSMQE